MTQILTETARQRLFTEARTANVFLDRPVDPTLMRDIYDLMKWGPTSMNGCPARISFLTTPEAKERAMPALIDGNIARAKSAPILAIIGMDMEFYHYLPDLYPHAPENKKIFENSEIAAQITAIRNSTLQGAYFIIAARSVGLDCGPMSGFDNTYIDQDFFAGTHVKSNFLCTLGYADPTRHYPRGPRFDFDEVCQVL